jgi:hypothetical protein
MQKHSKVGELVTSLLNDVERMVLEFYPPVSSGALQLYESALEFMPKCELRTLGMNAKRSGVQLVSEGYAQWGVILRVIEGHKGEVNSAASPLAFPIVPCGCGTLSQASPSP